MCRLVRHGRHLLLIAGRFGVVEILFFQALKHVADSIEGFNGLLRLLFVRLRGGSGLLLSVFKRLLELLDREQRVRTVVFIISW
jgi:hypothetical protein